MQCRSLLLLVGAVRKDQVDKHQPAASALNNQEGLRLVVFFRFNTSQLQTRSSFEVTFQSFAPLSRSEKKPQDLPTFPVSWNFRYFSCFWS